MKNVIILFTATIVFALRYAFSLVPNDGKGWFPFSKQIISKAAYIDYLCIDVGYVVICTALYFMTGKSNTALMLLVISIGYVFDYILIYNEPVRYLTFHNSKLGISYSLLAGIVLSVSLINGIIKWLF
ncbi:MAG: hypothetical protein QOA70_06765 [Nitrososphaeraceae archaeon]|nr:hypothetical protein [Nitrososphaeraceae archaeon]